MKTIKLNLFNSIADIGVIYAHEAGLFRQEGFDIEFYYVKEGREAIDTMLKDRDLFVRASSYVFVQHVLSGSDVRYIATIGETQKYFEFMCLADTDYYRLEDLSGKRVGVVFDSLDHFFAEYAFTFNNVPIESIEFVPMQRGEAVTFLENHIVDAVIVNIAEIHSIRKNIGVGIRVIRSDLLIGGTIGIVVSADYDFNTMRRVTQIISRSNAEIVNLLNNDIKKLARISGFAEEQLIFLRDNVSFEITLDHLLLLTSEAQMRWILRNSPGDLKAVDLSQYFDSSVIESVSE